MRNRIRLSGAIAQLGERLLCKQEVTGSIPVGSTPETPASDGFSVRLVGFLTPRLERLLMFCPSSPAIAARAPPFRADRVRPARRRDVRWPAKAGACRRHRAEEGASHKRMEKRDLPAA